MQLLDAIDEDDDELSGQLQKKRKKLKAQLEEAKREEARLEEDAPAARAGGASSAGGSMESLRELQREIDGKQEEMNNAVANQDFLGAAEIQKQIQDLKDELAESAKQAMQDAIASQDFIAAAEVQKLLTELGGGKAASSKKIAPSSRPQTQRTTWSAWSAPRKRSRTSRPRSATGRR